MKKSKKVSGKSIIVLLVLAAIIVVYCVHISNKMDEGARLSSSNKEVAKLLGKDLELEYPATPRDVLYLYSDIIKCFYNSKLSDDELEGLAGQVRKLFDEELLINNPEEEYMMDLKTEIKEYKSLKKTISNYIIQKNSSIEKTVMDGVEYASVTATYLTKEKKNYGRTYEEFMLRKDSDGKWKILGWKLLDPKEEGLNEDMGEEE